MSPAADIASVAHMTAVKDQTGADMTVTTDLLHAHKCGRCYAVVKSLVITLLQTFHSLCQ